MNVGNGSVMANSDDRDWQLYTRALAIFEGRSAGHALPIIRKLARRRFAPAVTMLSDYVSEAEAIRLLRAAARQGDAPSAYNLAITHRNRGDMLRYRTELARAARLDPDAASELRSFKTRFPEEVMRRFGRLAPERA
jgi:TPR repeat protein